MRFVSLGIFLFVFLVSPISQVLHIHSSHRSHKTSTPRLYSIAPHRATVSQFLHCGDWGITLMHFGDLKPHEDRKLVYSLSQSCCVSPSLAPSARGSLSWTLFSHSLTPSHKFEYFLNLEILISFCLLI